MTTDQSLPAPGLAKDRIADASDLTRQVAQALRAWFASTEQRSYPADTTGTGTRLHLTVDTTHTPEPPGSFRPGTNNAVDRRRTPPAEPFTDRPMA